MSDFNISSKDVAKLRRRLRKAGEDLGDFKAINKQAADLVAKEARRRVPVRSGAMSRSIKSSATQTRGKVRAGTVGASKKYAARQHWVQQKGRSGDQFIYKAVGAKGWDLAGLYYDFVERTVRKFNRGI